MRKKQNMLLAGVAALALVAGVSAASAQQNPQGKTGSTSVSGPSSTHAQTAKPTAGAGMEQHAQTGPANGAKIETKAGGAAAMNAKGTKQPAMAQKGSANAKGQRSAQEINRNKTASRANKRNKTASRADKMAEGRPQHLGANAKAEHNRKTARNEHERRGHMSTAERERNGHGRMNTAERNEHNLKGLQGNASIPMQGSHVSLTSEQRTRIRDTVIDAHNAPRAGHVDFNIRVGTLVPRREIHVIPVPRTLVEIDPVWRGYLYFVVRDEVVIVNPRDMRIVAVLPA